MKRTCKRRKAFLGAIIGAVTSIAGSAIGAAAQKKAQNKQIARENEANRNQSANNLSTAYSNEEYVDDFLNKTTFKYGGNKTMACGNRKTAKMGMSDRYKKQLETEAKNRQETKKRLSAKNTKPFPYVSTIAEQKGLKYYADTYDTNPFIKIIARNRKTIEDAKNNSTKRPASPVTQTRTAVKRNTNTISIANRTNTNVAKSNVRQNTTNRTNVPAKANATTNRPAQRTAQRTANTSTQRPAKPAVQKTTKQPNIKTTTNKVTTTKTTTQPARQNADNKLTFSRAFANARKAGKQTFNWNGKSYTTQLAGEKKNNTSEKSYDTTKLTDNKLMNAKETSKLLINTIPSASSVIPKSNTLNIADNNGYYDRIKMMKCGGKRKMKCGGKCKKK